MITRLIQFDSGYSDLPRNDGSDKNGMWNISVSCQNARSSRCERYQEIRWPTAEIYSSFCRRAWKIKTNQIIVKWSRNAVKCCLKTAYLIILRSHHCRKVILPLRAIKGPMTLDSSFKFISNVLFRWIVRELIGDVRYAVFWTWQSRRSMWQWQSGKRLGGGSSFCFRCSRNKLLRTFGGSFKSPARNVASPLLYHWANTPGWPKLLFGDWYSYQRQIFFAQRLANEAKKGDVRSLVLSGR